MIFRQGDILLIKVKAKPSALKKIIGPVVLGHGEATGHKHQIKDCAVAFAKDKETMNNFALIGGDDDIFIVVDAPTALTHEEHDPIDLDEGTYKVVRQREYTPERLLYVAD